MTAAARARRTSSGPIEFFVPGLAAPQGSKRIARRGDAVWLIDDNPAAKAAWRATVVQYASLHARREPLDGPLDVYLQFLFPMPQRRPAAVRAAGIAWKTTKPDIDKISRNVLDGLTEAHVIKDDARVAKLLASKLEVHPDGRHGECGVWITVAECAP